VLADTPVGTPRTAGTNLHSSPLLLLLQFESILGRKRAGGLDATIVNYPGQAHGFSLRGNSNDTAVAQAATTAFDAGKTFLDKHLK
jgi:hypothetical protein